MRTRRNVAQSKTRLRELIRLLRCIIPEGRSDAAFELGEFGSAASAAVPRLADLVRYDHDFRVRHNALLALTCITTGEETVQALAHALADGNAEVVTTAQNELRYLIRSALGLIDAFDGLNAEKQDTAARKLVSADNGATRYLDVVACFNERYAPRDLVVTLSVVSVTFSLHRALTKRLTTRLITAGLLSSQELAGFCSAIASPGFPGCQAYLRACDREVNSEQELAFPVLDSLVGQIKRGAHLIVRPLFDDKNCESSGICVGEDYIRSLGCFAVEPLVGLIGCPNTIIRNAVLLALEKLTPKLPKEMHKAIHRALVLQGMREISPDLRARVGETLRRLFAGEIIGFARSAA